MVTQIGIVAGEILTILEEVNRPMSLKSFQNYLDETSLDMIMMSIGWLAREGYIHIETVDGDCFVSRLAEYYARCP